jgi:hypothetical protein
VGIFGWWKWEQPSDHSFELEGLIELRC